MATKAIPNGFTSVTPHLIIRGAGEAIDFYKRAFNATELMRLASPTGQIGHAEIQIGNATVMLADEYPDMGIRGPLSLGGTPVSLLIYVEDVDARFNQAVAAGAKVVRPIKDQFYGDRSGTVQDPYGHMWTIATHKEDILPDELHRRFVEAMKQHAS
jgi:PhnB protein